MIKTFKIKHNQNLSSELSKAKQVANFAIRNRTKLSSKYVKNIGLKSAISNQILRKYGKNKKCRKITKVNLIVPGQAINVTDKTAVITPLKLTLNIKHIPAFNKINQIELSSKYALISVTIDEPNPFQPTSFVGLDRNASKHVAVLANPVSGKIVKLGKSCLHVRQKYRSLRSSAQSRGSFKLAKKLARRESNKMRDLNHKISRAVVDYCLENRVGLVLEDLKGIRKQRSKGKKMNGILHSWSFYQLEQFIQYKAVQAGVPVVKVDPRYTSQDCSRCGYLGTRVGKDFSCPECKHFDHADVNAAFNIAARHGRSCTDRDVQESLEVSEIKFDINTGKAQFGNVVEEETNSIYNQRTL